MAQFIEQQPITTLTRDELPAKVGQLKAEGWRIVHVACTALADALEITYAFDKDYVLANFRILVPKADPVVPSISPLYLAAFAYENELQDLFGMRVTGLVLDFKGTFYRKRHEAPFNPPACTAAPAPVGGK